MDLTPIGRVRSTRAEAVDDDWDSETSAVVLDRSALAEAAVVLWTKANSTARFNGKGSAKSLGTPRIVSSKNTPIRGAEFIASPS